MDDNTRTYVPGRNHIGCDAKNCSFNDRGVECTARHIDVSGKKAMRTGETRCSTFTTRD